MRKIASAINAPTSLSQSRFGVAQTAVNAVHKPRLLRPKANLRDRGTTVMHCAYSSSGLGRTP